MAVFLHKVHSCGATHPRATAGVMNTQTSYQQHGGLRTLLPALFQPPHRLTAWRLGLFPSTTHTCSGVDLPRAGPPWEPSSRLASWTVPHL